jgi:hypothetical protein
MMPEPAALLSDPAGLVSCAMLPQDPEHPFHKDSFD